MLIVEFVLLAALILWLTRRWGPSARTLAQLRRLLPYAVAYVRGAPATVVFTLLIMVTTTIYASSGSLVQHLLLSERSTNLRQLSRNPLEVLVSSAFWVGGEQLAIPLTLFLAVLVPLERWIGTKRLLVAFWTGHVLSTLIVAVALRLSINLGRTPESVGRAIDVGISYGTYCCCALFAYRFSGRMRWAWAAVWVLGGIVGVVLGGTFTDWGHLVTILIGLTLFPLTRNAGVLERRIFPIWRVRPGPADELLARAIAG